MFGKIIIHLGLYIILLIFFRVSFAQHFLTLTDEQNIQLQLDLIRKGIQQADTAKIFKVISQDIKSNDTYISKEIVLQRLQTVFDIPFERDMLLSRPNISRADSRIKNSNFWDFDILNPKIDISNDSIVVDCELVLWGERADSPSGKRGKRIPERFIFVSSQAIEKPVSNLDRIGTFEEISENPKSYWQLVEFGGFLEFFENCRLKGNPPNNDSMGD